MNTHENSTFLTDEGYYIIATFLFRSKTSKGTSWGFYMDVRFWPTFYGFSWGRSIWGPGLPGIFYIYFILFPVWEGRNSYARTWLNQAWNWRILERPQGTFLLPFSLARRTCGVRWWYDLEPVDTWVVHDAHGGFLIQGMSWHINYFAWAYAPEGYKAVFVYLRTAFHVVR